MAENETEKKFYKNGLFFGCQRCSFCCGHSPGFVYLSLRDLTELRNFLKMSVAEFVSVYCRWADYYYGEQVLALREKKNYDCILWKEGCSCYEARPIQCSTYPFWTWMIEDEATWNECGKDCPGINNKAGKFWSVEEIEKNKKLYDENIPLTRAEVEKLIAEETFSNS